MKDFENDLIYYPNPDPIEEPRFILNSVEELEKSTKYSVVCNGTERVVCQSSDSLSYNLSSGKMAKKLLILIRCKQGYSANLFLNNTINPTDSL